MSFVRVLCAAAAAVVIVASAAAAEPTVLAATEAGTAAGEPAAAPAPQSSEAVATAPITAETPQLDGHQASDAALPPAVALSTPPAAEAVAPLAPPEPTLFGDINLATQTMTVSDASGELGRWSISSARGGYSTPAGTFTVHYISRMHYSKQYGFAPMPYSVFFNEGVAVHGTNAIGNLGNPASHGCVRAHPQNAKIFYNLVEKHGMQMTRVTVHGKPPYSPVIAERRQRRYAAAPTFQPFGFFGGDPPVYQPRQRRKTRQQYGSGYGNTW